MRQVQPRTMGRLPYFAVGVHIVMDPLRRIRRWTMCTLPPELQRRRWSRRRDDQAHRPTSESGSWTGGRAHEIARESTSKRDEAPRRAPRPPGRLASREGDDLGLPRCTGPGETIRCLIAEPDTGIPSCKPDVPAEGRFSGPVPGAVALELDLNGRLRNVEFVAPLTNASPEVAGRSVCALHGALDLQVSPDRVDRAPRRHGADREGIRRNVRHRECQRSASVTAV